MKEQLESLSDLTINFGQGGTTIVNILLAFIMFGVALGIKLDTFKDVFKNPKSLIVGLVLQWVCLPALTTLLAILMNNWITPMVALGMILVSSCPGGNISNFMSSFAKGNVELSVSMTAITSAFATFITPLNFFLWGNLYYRTVSIAGDVPELVIPFLPMFGQVLILLGIPIVLGMLFAKYYPKATEKIMKPFQVLSIVVFFGMVIIAFAQNFQIFIDNIIYIFFIVLIHNACALGLGYGGGALFKRPAIDRRSLTIEVGIQNSGLGLVLLFNPVIFPPEIWHHQYGGMLLVTAWWGVWHIVSGLTVATGFRRSSINK
ncbi:MAG: bile acid:sodium symporter family protein [Bacteroidales bacterium]|nr:bile acid:sodium symporter family protein [Bacteroidales bacterium]